MPFTPTMAIRGPAQTPLWHTRRPLWVNATFRDGCLRSEPEREIGRCDDRHALVVVAERRSSSSYRERSPPSARSTFLSCWSASRREAFHPLRLPFRAATASSRYARWASRRELNRFAPERPGAADGSDLRASARTAARACAAAA